jgi:hypothetical protein
LFFFSFYVAGRGIGERREGYFCCQRTEREMRKELLLFIVLLAETEKGCGRELKSFFCYDSKLRMRRESCCKTEEAQRISAAKIEREERT